MAVYTLARGYAGTEILVYIGAVMTLFPIFFAEIENDLRRVLAYSLNNQLGFMVVGVGIGTPLALNGTAAHAFCHILYKALLFMSVGAVLYRTGHLEGRPSSAGSTRRCRVTMLCCLVGAASISAFPLFSGFVSKSLILSASAENGYYLVWGALLVASAGVAQPLGHQDPLLHVLRPRQRQAPGPRRPRTLQVAMIVTAVACVAIGVFPGTLYALLPYAIDYVPYTVDHVLTQLQAPLLRAARVRVPDAHGSASAGGAGGQPRQATGSTGSSRRGAAAGRGPDGPHASIGRCAARRLAALGAALERRGAVPACLARARSRSPAVGA